MDSSCNKSCTKDNATKVFELIITNPCSEPSEPVEISCVVKDLTANANILDTQVGKDGVTDSQHLEATDTAENQSMDVEMKNIEVNTETSNIVAVKESVGKIAVDYNDNQKNPSESVILLDEINTDNLEQTKLSSDQLTTKNLEKKDVSSDSDIDLYETELENITALNANKTDSDVIVLEKEPQNAEDFDTDKCLQTEKAGCSDNIDNKDDTTIDSDPDVYETQLQNVETINGNREDSDVIVLDSKTNSENTIIQDDKEVNNLTKTYPSIDLAAEEDPCCNSRISNEYADEFKKNSLLAELVQKCLNMDGNGGMSRVINRTLLNIYTSVEENYKNSDKLRKVLTRTIMKLHMEPEFKFSHIKCLCDHLKLHIVKKRVPFVTLEKRSTGDQLTSNIPTKKKRLETIDLDDYAVNETEEPRIPKEYPPIEIDDSSSSIEEVNDVIVLDNDITKKKKRKRKKHKKRTDRQKKTLVGAFIPTLVRNPFSTLPDSSEKEREPTPERIPIIATLPEPTLEPIQISSLQTDTTTQKLDDMEEPQIQNIQPLLTPVVMQAVPLNSGNSDQLAIDDPWIRNEIKGIENHIAFLRKEIEKVEVMEVQEDNERSPYIVSEHLQSILVKQYKRLCELTGTEEKKQHKVRLQVLPGHPEAPVRYFQEYLNDNIDAEGNPPFPDLYDVIQCVSKANVECHMNWGQAQIMKEARALFIQFGRTMQRRRQKREWKDLMSRVKEEVNDPAERDSALMMKLDRNAWIAKQKETELLNRYANLEENGLSASLVNELSNRIEDGEPDSETESSEGETPSRPVTNSCIQTFERQNKTGSSPSSCLSNGGIQLALTSETSNIVGSSISLSNGCIEIAPTYAMQNVGTIIIPNGIISTLNTSRVNCIQNKRLDTFAVNDNQNVISTEKKTSNSNLNMYSLAYENFTLRSTAAANARKCILGTFVNSDVCSHDINGSAVNNSNVSIVNNSNVVTVNTDNIEVDDASNLAKTILKLIRNDAPSSTANASKITNKIPSNQASTPKSTELKVKEETEEKNYESVCDIFTHKAKPTNIINENTQSKERLNCMETTNKISDYNQVSVKSPSEPETKDISVEGIVKPELQASEETASEAEAKDIPEDIVKAEPLDIPRMLDNLGDDYTAVVFDIEDPFLVIEISDSSESEDEVT